MGVWQRLLWKEYRESGPFVLIGVLLPLLCLAFHNLRGDSVQFPIVIIVVMIAVWAAARAQERRDSGNIPISVPMRLATRYLLPMAGALPIGLSLGYLIFRRISSASGQTEYLWLTTGLCLLLYLLCTVTSVVYGLISAVIAGVLLLMPIFSTFSFSSEFHPRLLQGMLLYLLLVVLITGVCAEGLRGKYRVMISRLVPLLIGAPLLLLLTGSFADFDRIFPAFSPPSLNASLPTGKVSYLFGYNFAGQFVDRTLFLDYDVSRKAEICLLDRRLPRRYFIAPERIAPGTDTLRALTCLDDHVVLFAAQAQGDAHIRVLAWDALTGTVTPCFRFTGWRDMITGNSYCSISPDNHYLLLGVTSRIGRGDDLWLLDLSRHRATLVVPNCAVHDYAGHTQQDNREPSLQQVVWTPQRVLLKLMKRYLAVDLNTLRVEQIRIGR